MQKSPLKEYRYLKKKKKKQWPNPSDASPNSETKYQGNMIPFKVTDSSEMDSFETELDEF